MRRTYYVPENAALFMCGPFAPDEVFELLVSLAPVADGAPDEDSAPGGESKTSVFNLATIASSVTTGKGGRYVLVSDGFSKEFNQISLQYVLPESFMTAAEAAAAETAALVLENGSAFKSLVLKDETCGIKSADWLYTSLSRQQSGSRFIVQALMENGEVSPGTQALAFARCIENPDVFPADEVAYFSRITADRLSLLRRDPFTLIHTLAEDWAFCMPVFPELNRALSEQGLQAIPFNKSFAEQFTASYAVAARSLSAAELSHVLDSEPYIFLLLNNDVYKANKNALEKEGFTLIQQDKGEWYKTGEYKLGDYKLGGNPATPFESEHKSFTGLAAEKLALVIVAELQLSDATASRASSVQTEIAYSGEQAQSVAQDANLAQNFDGIDNYIAHGKTATKLETLSNGIPVLVQNGTSSAFSFKIQFSGKKEGFSAPERDMRTVISDVIANNIRQYILRSGAVPYSGFSVSPECTLYGSSVVVSTTTEYAEPVISLAAEALFFGEISAPRIDESAYSRSSELSLKRADGDFQLHSAALARLYQGTVGADYFDLKGDFLANITFQDIEMEYLSMLDASCISLSVYGENASNYLSLAEDCFGFLRSFSSSCRDSAVSAPSTSFPDETVPVTLRRIFTSSVKPGEYVAQPPKLIPTEVFYDPFHIYFECPAYDSPEYAVFVALVYELADVLDEMWEPGVLPSIDMLYAPIASVWFHGVTRAADVYDVFTKGIEKLQEPFDEARIKKICDRYVEKFCSQEDSATSCTDKMLVSRFYSSKVTNGGITVYLSQFEQLKNATSKDFAKIAARFKTLPLLRSVSADTK
jgi:zinc protease